MVRNFIRAFCVIYIAHTFAYHAFAYPFTDDVSTLVKRAVTWVNVRAAFAQDCNCNDAQKQTLELHMQEAIELAKAGYAGFEVIEDMINGPETGSRFINLFPTDQWRYRETFLQFFGRYDGDDWAQIAQMIGHVKDVLGRIKDSSVETWPSTVRFACAGTYYRKKDRVGNTPEQLIAEGRIRPLHDPRKNEYYFDYELVDEKGEAGIWNEDRKGRYCEDQVAAWTQNFKQKIREQGEKLDRLTFCPKWFDIAQEHGPLDGTHIEENKELQSFARKGARLFLHESLHTWPWNLVKYDAPSRLKDIEGGRSYGPANVARIARTTGKDGLGNPGAPGWVRSFENIETIVYWCIAMYFDDWAWDTLQAQPLSVEPPGFD